MVDQNKLLPVQNVVIHPGFKPAFNPQSWDANLALLKVDIPFKFNDTNVQPACLELDHPRKFYKEQLVALGFGVTEIMESSDEHYDFGKNSRYLLTAFQEDNSKESPLCRKKNLDELVCTYGGSGKQLAYTQ